MKGTTDTLDRMREYRKRDHWAPPITPAEAVALCEHIAGRFDDDELTFDLVTLLRGLYALYEAGRKDRSFAGLEEALIFGELRAYMHTVHAHAALDEFARLDLQDARDRRVLRREFSEAHRRT